MIILLKTSVTEQNINDVLDSAKLEGKIEGRLEGRAEGREEGREEGIKEGVLRNARRMKEKDSLQKILWKLQD